MSAGAGLVLIGVALLLLWLAATGKLSCVIAAYQQCAAGGR